MKPQENHYKKTNKQKGEIINSQKKKKKKKKKKKIITLDNPYLTRKAQFACLNMANKKCYFLYAQNTSNIKYIKM